MSINFERIQFVWVWQHNVICMQSSWIMDDLWVFYSRYFTDLSHSLDNTVFSSHDGSHSTDNT